MNGTNGSSLPQDLDRLAGLAGRDLGQNHRLIARVETLHLFAKFAPLPPTLWLLRNLFGMLLGLPTGNGWIYCGVPALLLCSVSLVPYVRSFFLAVARRRSLAAADKALDLQDRLQTADEFLRFESRTPFMEAALADAAEYAERSVEVSIPPEQGARGATFLEQMGPLLAGVILVGAIVCSDGVVTAKPAPADELAKSQPTSNVTEPGQLDTQDTPTPPVQKPESAVPSKANPASTLSTESRKDTADLRDGKRMSRGLTRPGTPAGAVAASGQGNARGAPSDQSQKSKGSQKKNKKKKKPSKKKPTDPGQTKKEEVKKETGTTAGRGAAGGSSKNPAPSQWTSRDQVTSEEEEDLEDDAEVDDEFDNSDSRGGLQPALRDRKPPVNRDLGIGFGNRKNPDANGRGGPSEQKKSRGVASLVLGVPIPDHIKGKPNPGKTKITQERVEPAAEDAAQENALTRRGRRAPMGTWSDIPLSPVMRRLIRDYFLNRRTGANGD